MMANLSSLREIRIIFLSAGKSIPPTAHRVNFSTCGEVDGRRDFQRAAILAFPQQLHFCDGG
jgi:hypothetical protein